MKIDLSEENVKKTIVYDDMKAQNLKTKYDRVGIIIADRTCSQMMTFKGFMSVEKFRKAFKDRTVLSAHDYDDMKYTSVIIERLVN